MKYPKVIALVAISFFFIQCGSPSKKDTPNNNDTTQTSENDTSKACCSKHEGGEEGCCAPDSSKTDIVMETEMTCPECGHKQMETMSKDDCVKSYRCDLDDSEIAVGEDDCCVYCAYGSNKCPGMQ